MKRIFLILLSILSILFLCGCASHNQAYEHERFTLVLPDGWSRVDTDGVVCFAKNGSPVRSSSIVFYATEKNYYFDTFEFEDYAAHINTYSQYEQISANDFSKLKIDGWNAHRVTYNAVVDQSPVVITMYSIDADMTYIFALMEVEGETYQSEFDDAMSNIKIH